MVKSLQEQLMGSGLVDKKKAKAIEKEKRKHKKQTPKGHIAEDKTKQDLELKRIQKIEKDKELNRKRVEELEKKAIAAQVKQLIKMNEVKREKGDSPFQFTFDKKIKRIYVDANQFEYLAKGMLAIALLDEDFILVPKGAAQKISERDPSSICYLFEKGSDESTEDLEEDPYKGFEIPDDLMW